MTVLVVGGAGFIGLNIVEALLRHGGSVVVFDRMAPPSAAREAFSAYPGRLDAIVGDVTDPTAVAEAVRPGTDAIVFGAAITADAARDAAEPDRILAVNLAAFVPVLMRARDVGVRRVVNLSSAAAYGDAAFRCERLDEETPADPAGLYAITKFASERVGARLGGLWNLDVVSVRLSAAFGPWERATGVRDTLSPPAQIMLAAERGEPALLPRPGIRDWTYAPDIAEAVVALLDAKRPRHGLYNVSSGATWPALAWGERLAALRPGFVCRLTGEGETPTIDLHAPADRAPMSVTRMRDDLGWQARFGLDASVADFDRWRRRHGAGLGG